MIPALHLPFFRRGTPWSIWISIDSTDKQTGQLVANEILEIEQVLNVYYDLHVGGFSLIVSHDHTASAQTYYLIEKILRENFGEKQYSIQTGA